MLHIYINFFCLDYTLDDSIVSTEEQKSALGRCIQALTHACQCRKMGCQSASCYKMKKVLTHTKECKIKSNGDCKICKQLVALCCYHAKKCRAEKCFVPYCQSIKEKLKGGLIKATSNFPDILEKPWEGIELVDNLGNFFSHKQSLASKVSVYSLYLFLSPKYSLQILRVKIVSKSQLFVNKTVLLEKKAHFFGNKTVDQRSGAK